MGEETQAERERETPSGGSSETGKNNTELYQKDRMHRSNPGVILRSVLQLETDFNLAKTQWNRVLTEKNKNIENLR